eukprot:scaffold3337_cov256-Chaetoceros_neogracile.AAC.7
MKCYQIAGVFALMQQSSSGFAFSKHTNKSTSLGMGGYDATIGADPSTPLQFFLFPGNTCPNAQRTHIALHELGIPFDITEVSGHPAPDWYLKINPRGKVPAIRIPSCDYEVIHDSAICNEFLCDYASSTLKKDHNLMPQDPILRARARLLNDHCDSVLGKAQFTFLMNKDTEEDAKLAAEVEKALEVYEEALNNSDDGPFLLGAEFTLADLHVLPFIQRLVITLRHWKNFEIPSSKFVKLLVWLDVCLERDSVKQSSMTKEKTLEIYKIFVESDYAFGGLNEN